LTLQRSIRGSRGIPITQTSVQFSLISLAGKPNLGGSHRNKLRFFHPPGVRPPRLLARLLISHPNLPPGPRSPQPTSSPLRFTRSKSPATRRSDRRLHGSGLTQDNGTRSRSHLPARLPNPPMEQLPRRRNDLPHRVPTNQHHGEITPAVCTSHHGDCHVKARKEFAPMVPTNSIATNSHRCERFRRGAISSDQLPRKPLAFEVATIRPSPPDSTDEAWHGQGDRVTIRGYSLRQLIKAAFDLKTNAQIIGGPDWIDKQRVDISAKIADEQMSPLAKPLPIAISKPPSNPCCRPSSKNGSSSNGNPFKGSCPSSL
jgi:hypothetical protein